MSSGASHFTSHPFSSSFSVWIDIRWSCDKTARAHLQAQENHHKWNKLEPYLRQPKWSVKSSYQTTPYSELSRLLHLLQTRLPRASPPTGLQTARRQPLRDTDEAMEGESERSSIICDNAEASRVFNNVSLSTPTSKEHTSCFGGKCGNIYGNDKGTLRDTLL